MLVSQTYLQFHHLKKKEELICNFFCLFFLFSFVSILSLISPSLSLKTFIIPLAKLILTYVWILDGHPRKFAFSSLTFHPYPASHSQETAWALKEIISTSKVAYSVGFKYTASLWNYISLGFLYISFLLLLLFPLLRR